MRSVVRAVNHPIEIGQYYHGEDRYRSGRFRTRWHGWCSWVRADHRRLWAARFLGSGVFVAVCLGRFETIPYSKRNHFVILRREWEKMLGEYTFEEMKKEKTTGSILSDRYLQTRRVRRIANEITQALMRGISREDKEKGRRWWRGSRVATSHLDGLKWEIYVVDQPIINACCLPGGKIVVFTGLLRHFKSDEEIATILGHEFGHAVARHTAETITNYMWLVILQLIFFQFFSGAVAAHSFDKLSNLLFSLPFSRRMEMEADHIGLLLLASAGYDPRVAPGVYQKLKLAGETPNQKDYLSTHPTGKKRAEKLAEANVMKEALSIYQDVQAARGGRRGFLRR
ncbi:mitochondrial metalloendopeptidase OMA1-like [Rosa rugosa]|uniref:mitochondrial metalloendopeptidase OMA1-like n=1 Tax=Rosa rugosa TaxID=74645 RepID=UPI002B40B4ED|nr:mitochondrial metalloendopeptidase OMA1-like [Rosa rugosa]